MAKSDRASVFVPDTNHQDPVGDGDRGPLTRNVVINLSFLPPVTLSCLDNHLDVNTLLFAQIFIHCKCTKT